MPLNITLPVGRMVQGDLYAAKKNEKKPEAAPTYFCGYAIKKGNETHWSQTPWGKLIWDLGHAESAATVGRPDFAWKIVDGDSAVPNRKNKKPCDNPDFRGHWIVRISSTYAPKLYIMQGSGVQSLVEPGYVKPGHFIEANVQIKANGQSESPGIYINHNMICWRAFGPIIEFGPDADDVGFGAGALPAGASAVPPSGPMPAAPQAAPAPAPATNVHPNVAFVQNAAGAVQAPPAPVAAPPVPAAPVRQMTAAANGATYEQYVAAGWTDAQLVANGLMLP